uniref:Uncharacterized protein n=1 Tax=Oryza barthii TaxID=65489 RepID=A0A0D3F676_9ORYZ
MSQEEQRHGRQLPLATSGVITFNGVPLSPLTAGVESDGDDDVTWSWGDNVVVSVLGNIGNMTVRAPLRRTGVLAMASAALKRYNITAVTSLSMFMFMFYTIVSTISPLRLFRDSSLQCKRLYMYRSTRMGALDLGYGGACLL